MCDVILNHYNNVANLINVVVTRGQYVVVCCDMVIEWTAAETEA